jgi:hypothetical protein
LREWADVLPGHLDSRGSAILRLSEDETFHTIFQLQHDAAQYDAAGAKADWHDKRGLRVRNLPSHAIDPVRVKAYQKELEEAFGAVPVELPLGQLPATFKELLGSALDSASAFIARMGEVGPQSAFLETLPVAGITKAKQSKLTLDEHITRWLLESQIRSVARELLAASQEEEEALLRSLEAADCPGFWIARKLESCVARGSLKPRPNHYFDVQRLAYLPYVEVLLTDSEMVEFMRQIREDESTPEQIRELPAARCIPSSIDALEEVIRSMGTR